VNQPGIDSVYFIIATVARSFGITSDDVLGSSRTNRAAAPRQIALHLIRKRSVLSMAAIGKVFDRDHSTVSYSLRIARKRIESNRWLAQQVEEIEAALDAPVEEPAP